MALLEINLRPSDRELRWFGLIMLLFFAVLGGLIWLASGATVVPGALGAAGFVLCSVYYLVRPLRRLLYVAWMRTVFPIGWIMSHALMGSIYFAILTPIGWLLRATGRDPMQRRMLKDARTYWIERRRENAPAQYFRQF